MATTSVKRKKFSLTTLFTVILAILPEVLRIFNDPEASDSLFLKVEANPLTGKVKSSIVDVGAEQAAAFARTKGRRA